MCSYCIESSNANIHLIFVLSIPVDATCFSKDLTVDRRVVKGESIAVSHSLESAIYHP